jgi:hypothetical protein
MAGSHRPAQPEAAKAHVQRIFEVLAALTVDRLARFDAAQVCARVLSNRPNANRGHVPQVALRVGLEQARCPLPCGYSAQGR